MANCTSCKGRAIKTTVLPSYEAVGLGAPFKVILQHAVKVETCQKCNTVKGTYIPDLEGLFHAVVFTRALDLRRLVGAEMRFMRKAMGWKAKELARHLGISAEYLSRCESGAKVMAPSTEKLFRLYALLRTPDRSALNELDLSKLFDLIQIEGAWDASKPLTFRFFRTTVPAEQVREGDWKWRPRGDDRRRRSNALPIAYCNWASQDGE